MSAAVDEFKSLGVPGALARREEPEEVAALICFLLGPESRFISGVAYVIDGGTYC